MPAKTRSAHRKKRPRRPMVGMMLHQDASTHAWLPGDARKYDLVVTMEDATSALYSLFLVDQEGTASSLRGVREVVAKHGLFCSLYTDRGSHYFVTPEAGGRVSKTVLTQFGRALKQLGIEHIAAYSPQARGRSERVFGTLQDRLPKELALAGITTVEAANRLAARGLHRLSTMRGSRSLRSRRDRRSWPMRRGPGVRSCAFRRIARLGNDNTVKWQRTQPATATEPVAATLREGDGAGARVSGWPAGGVLGAAPAGRLRRAGHPRSIRTTGRMTRFQRGASVPGHAPAQSKNEADRSRATKTGRHVAAAAEQGLAHVTGNRRGCGDRRIKIERDSARQQMQRAGATAVDRIAQNRTAE